MAAKSGRVFTIIRGPLGNLGYYGCLYESEYGVLDQTGVAFSMCALGFKCITGITLRPGQKARFRLVRVAEKRKRKP